MEITKLTNKRTKNVKLLDEFNSLPVIIDDTLSKLKDRSIEVTQYEQQRENTLKNEQSIKNLWDNKRSNIHILEVPKEKRKEYGTKSFPNLVLKINL